MTLDRYMVANRNAFRMATLLREIGDTFRSSLKFNFLNASVSYSKVCVVKLHKYFKIFICFTSGGSKDYEIRT